MGRVDKWLLDISFQLPIGRPPDLDSSIIRLGSKVLSNGIPDNAIDVTLMKVQPFE
jgi:hypothetical protein